MYSFDSFFPVYLLFSKQSKHRVFKFAKSFADFKTFCGVAKYDEDLYMKCFKGILASVPNIAIIFINGFAMTGQFDEVVNWFLPGSRCFFVYLTKDPYRSKAVLNSLTCQKVSKRTKDNTSTHLSIEIRKWCKSKNLYPQRCKKNLGHENSLFSIPIDI